MMIKAEPLSRTTGLNPFCNEIVAQNSSFLHRSEFRGTIGGIVHTFTFFPW